MGKQPFSIEANALAKLSIVFVIALVLGGVALATTYVHSDYYSGKDEPVPQPVPFSHKHHVQGLGLDCRFCHTSVERSKSAGYPDTQTCMTCHSQIWRNAKVLDPVRESYSQGSSLEWVRVHWLPGYVYFDHSIHIAKGVGCVSCHGEVSQMAAVQQVRTFYMNDCLECHQNPEKYVRPKEEIWNEKWKPSSPDEGARLVREYHISAHPITNCYECHR